MSIRNTVVLGVMLIAAAAGAQQAASLKFDKRGVTIEGMRPGTTVAWMALVRKRVEYHIEVRVIRGVDVITPNGGAFVELVGADQAHAIWTVADISNGKAFRATPPAYSHSQRPVPISASVGADRLTVAASAAELMYVRPRRGVWSFGSMDGARLDADRAIDGTITVKLSSLTGYKGNPHPPEQVQAGDIILALNTQQARVGQLEVTK